MIYLDIIKNFKYVCISSLTQQTFTYLTSTIDAVEKYVKHVQS